MSKMTKEQKQERVKRLREITEAYAAGVTPEHIQQQYPALIARYSFRNVCLILGQRENATECAGFHDWNKVGRKVAKGAKGIAILVPMRKQEEGSDTERVWFTWRYVFDIADTEPMEKEEAA